MINRGGLKVFPDEVKEVLRRELSATRATVRHLGRVKRAMRLR
jgi:hypothetical protein